MLCLQQISFFIIYDGLWGICLLVGLVLVLPSFFPLGCFRSSERPVAEWVFSHMVHNLQSHFPVSAAVMLISIRSWHQTECIHWMQYRMSCFLLMKLGGECGGVGTGGELCCKISLLVFQKEWAFRNRLWFPRNAKSCVWCKSDGLGRRLESWQRKHSVN